MSAFKYTRILFVITLFFFILTCGKVFASTGIYDIDAREKLVKKYSHAVNVNLQFFSLKGKETNEQMRIYFNMIDRLNDDKSKKMTELLVDLIDFHIGETDDDLIYQYISTREKNIVILLLKKKLLEKPLSREKSLKERNEIIAELLRRMTSNVKYIMDPAQFDPVEEVRAWLFRAQMDLEKYYCTHGIYPEKLSSVFLTPYSHGSDVIIIDGEENEEKIEYKSFGSTYFIRASGRDGIFGTKDDVDPPYLTEIYSFPRRKGK